MESLESYNDLKQDVRKADHELELLDQELSNTKDEIALECTRQHKLHSTLNDNQKKLNDLMHRIQHMTQQKTDLTQQEKDKRTELTELEGMVAECGASLEEQQQEDQKRDEQLEKLRKELIHVNQVVEQLEQRAASISNGTTMTNSSNSSS
ncbi:hypothetical protein BDA99DRAFT_314190 [Phascolomyces articulosus]|uniref:Uncharacterized protein n=1 Tax=Phascolomyces articulosus TaxID=60185 RepID=A0AAD5JKN8_9FUNG|nr:hypothetical protein BDA99DRAFT_314190 [Phascolomyces articulosus]